MFKDKVWEGKNSVNDYPQVAVRLVSWETDEEALWGAPI